MKYEPMLKIDFSVHGVKYTITLTVKAINCLLEFHAKGKAILDLCKLCCY